ncbi:MAG: hypothetical protein R2941_14505 [Desulfobacterales bacterium]
MVKRVEDFVFHMMSDVFNSRDTAPIVIDLILKTGSYDPGPKSGRIEDPALWTKEKIIERAKPLSGEKGPKGNFDD